MVPRIFSEGPMISVPSVCPSVCLFLCNALSPSQMSQIFWNLVCSLFGVKVRECLSLFLIFAKFGSPGPKNGNFWLLFGHFRSFSDLIFSSEWIFLLFQYDVFGHILKWFAKIVKKGSKFGPPGPKNDYFGPILAIFTVFWTYRFF